MTKLFATVTAASESKPWFFSLIHQLSEFWEEQRNPPKPIQLTATPVEVPEMWSKHRARVPRLLSVLVHGMMSSGGGGGGKHKLTPPSLGKLPRAADKQLAPPDPEPAKNLDPTLIVEPSVVAPQLASLPQLNLLNIGDPDGITGPPSAGSGNGFGVGTGDDHGIGAGKGPGVGPGKNGGYGDTPFHIGGGISSPVLVTQILPEYSEEARKARFQGRVVLDTIVLEDGTVKVVRVARGVGFGLDEKAIAAVVQWRFRPARMNGKPVPVALNVEINFNLR
ncbi:MAG: energy transducer TonB [Acidobacteria bacterium]|nr:MAG: energy transducer TonB [Acidobacteriota bacterium]